MWQVLDWLASVLTTDEIQARHPVLEPADFRACLAFVTGRLRPLSHLADMPENEQSEQWLLGCQGRWLARQEFLK